jgi:hypothetical protein
MLPELLEQDHRQQAGTGPAPGQHMEGRRHLADLLAVAAGEFLANVPDHLPLPRNDLQRLGDVLAQFAQPRTAAAQAGRRSRLDHPFPRQMFGERLSRRVLAGEGRYIGGLGHRPLGGNLVLGGRTLQLLEPQLHLVEQSHAAFRALAKPPDGKAWPTVRVRELRERLGVAAFDPTLRNVETVSAEHAARRLGICVGSLHKLIRTGVLPATQLMQSATWEIPASALETDLVKIGAQRIAARRPTFYKRFQVDKSLKLPGF